MTRFRALLHRLTSGLPHGLLSLLAMLQLAVGTAVAGIVVVFLLIESLAAPVQVLVLLSCIAASAVFVYRTLQRLKQLEPAAAAAKYLVWTIGALLASTVLFGVASGILDKTRPGLFDLSICEQQQVNPDFMLFAYEQFAKSATGDLCESFDWCDWSCVSHNGSVPAELLVFCYRTFVGSSTLITLLLCFRYRHAALDYYMQ